jgi:hypothetical protein
MELEKHCLVFAGEVSLAERMKQREFTRNWMHCVPKARGHAYGRRMGLVNRSLTNACYDFEVLPPPPPPREIRRCFHP